MGYCESDLIHHRMEQRSHYNLYYNGTNISLSKTSFFVFADTVIHTVLPRCYALLAVTSPPPPPPPIFGRNYCIGLFYLHYTPPPHGPLEPVKVCSSAFLHVYACCKCRRSACRK